MEPPPVENKETEVGLFEQILIDTNPDITSGIFQAALLFGLPSVALYLWLNRGSVAQGKRLGWCIAGIAAAILLWLLFPLPLYLYSLELKYPNHVNLGARKYFGFFISNAPAWARSVTSWLGSPAFAPPPVWLVLFIALAALVGFVLYRRFPIAGGKVNRPPTTLEARTPLGVPPVEPQFPPPDPGPPVPTCTWQQLTWQRNRESWQPLCPRCSRVMGVVEKQPKGMFVKAGGPVAEAVCSIPGCNEFRKPLSLRGSALQSRLQKEYEAQSKK